MKIALAQLNYHIGNFEGNLQKMLVAVQQAKEGGADLICFAELATCGYPPRDFLEFEDFIRLADEAIQKLAQAADGIVIIAGSPTPNPVPEGKDLYNSAYVLADKKIAAIRHKALLPNYDVFDEYRYFEPATEFEPVEILGKKIALTVCEDIWNIGNENPLYTTCPMDHLILEKPDFMINISASPFNYNNPVSRTHVVRSNVDRYGIPMFYVNHCGAQTELIFDGGSMVMCANGQLFDRLPYFEEAVRIYELDEVMAASRQMDDASPSKMELIHDALILGLRDYFGKLGFQKAVIGLSGGIDSALTAALAAEALGSENVRGVLMPSQFSSEHSVSDAVQLAQNLGIKHEIIPIESIYRSFESALAAFEGLPFNIAEENIQARIRGILVMGFSNKFGEILLNTSNKSEMAVGYGTLYGDMCGGLSVIGDLYKTEVYELSRWINRNGEIIPENTLTKAPSAELRPDQKDSDSLPDYDILDAILFQYIENRKSPQAIIQMGFEEALVKRVLRLVNINEFKRYQTAPVLRVSTKAFGMGRRMPIVGKYLS